MITNPVLEEKDRVQGELAEAAGYDVKKYSELVHRLFLEMQEQYGLQFKYADRVDELIQPVGSHDLSSPPTLVKA
jgi:hypothetical protein